MDAIEVRGAYITKARVNERRYHGHYSGGAVDSSTPIYEGIYVRVDDVIRLLEEHANTASCEHAGDEVWAAIETLRKEARI